MYVHDQQRILQWGVLLLSALVCSTSATTGMVRTSVVVLAALPFGWAAGRWGLLEALHLSSLCMLATLWAAQLTEHKEKLLVPTVLIPILLYVLFLLSRSAALLVEGLQFHVHEFFSAFSNPRFFGYWVTLTLPLLASVETEGSSARYSSLIRYGIGGLWFCFVLISGTRGTWIALAIATVFCSFCGPAGRLLSVRLLMSAAIGVLLYLVFFCLLPQQAADGIVQAGAGRILDGARLSSRDQLWEIAVKGTLANPWVGHGPMMFAAAVNRVASHPHSLTLQLAYEWGIPIASVCLVAIGLFVFRSLRWAQDQQDPRFLAVTVAIAGGLVQANLDGVLVMPFSQMYVVLLVAWSISIRAGQAAHAGHAHTSRAAWCGRLFRFGLVLNVLAQIALSSPEWRDLRQWEERSLDVYGVDVYQPRFWVQGIIPGKERIINR